MTRNEVLSEANRLIHGDRAVDYGDAQTSFEDISAIWSAILRHQVSPQDVARCMIALKMVRLSASPQKVDSWVDIAGYAAIGGELASHRGSE